MKGRRPHRMLIGLSLAFAIMFVPVAHAKVVDARSPDTKDAAALAQQTNASVDLRSPDTRDATTVREASPPAVIVDRGIGFDWADAGIGVVGGLAIALMLTGTIVLLRPGQRQWIRSIGR